MVDNDQDLLRLPVATAYSILELVNYIFYLVLTNADWKIPLTPSS